MSAKLSKENIKSRMLRDAANLWGFKDAEIESFDPLVSLLFGACASEISKVSDEIHSSRTRILSRLAELITPDVLTGTKPAHGIMHARPVESNYKVSVKDQFFTRKKMHASSGSTPDAVQELFFSPSGEFETFDGDIGYLASNISIQSVENVLYKERIAEAIGGKRLDSSTLWVGLHVKGNTEKLNELSFFFDWKNDPDKYAHYALLSFVKWELHGVELNSKAGYSSKIDEKYAEDVLNIEDEFNVSYKIEKAVNLFYQSGFVTVSIDNEEFNLDQAKGKHPEDFYEVFGQEAVEQLDDDLVWFKLSFPPAIPTRAVEEAYCAINAIPVINRRINEFSYRLQSDINIIPLNNADHFLTISNIQNQAGEWYSPNPISAKDDYGAGTYILRKGGVKRFDERDGLEILNYVLDLLRDESMAFSAMGYQAINSDVRELNQTLARLEKKVNSGKSANEPVPFLLVKAKYPSDHLFIHFWTTNGTNANDLKAGDALEMYSGSDFERNSLMLITSTVEGDDKLNATDSIHSYRSALLSRGRIVTKEDIKAACHHELGSRISMVEVKKGIMTGQKTKSGLIRTIDVWLKPSSRDRLTDEAWDSIRKNIQITLETSSSGTTPIRVFVNN